MKLDYTPLEKIIYKDNAKAPQYIRFIVDEYTIKDAVLNKWVVALDYEGDLGVLEDLEPFDIPVIVTRELSEITELSVMFLMKTIPDWVVVSIRTPSGYKDMRMIEKLSKIYPNIRFCGGKFLRLPNCNIGCIQKEDVRKIPSNIEYYTDGCACAIKTVDFSSEYTIIL